MKNSYKNLIGANINLNIDYMKMLDELLTVIKNNRHKVKPVIGLGGGTGDSLLLRTTPETDSHDFRDCKSANIDSWSWDDGLDIPYTRSVLESLPISPLGMVIVNTSTKTSKVHNHVDWHDLDDYENTLGLTLRLCVSQKALNTFAVWVKELQKFVPLTGPAILLNDSCVHHVMTLANDISQWEDQIYVKILGKFDYTWFDERVDPNCCYYR